MVFKNIDHLVKTTLKNLSIKALDATPNNYKNEFCKVAKKYDLTVQECEQFTKLISKLSQSQKVEVEEKHIDSIDNLFDFLISKISVKNIDKLATLINSSITPSISFELDEHLDRFCVKIGDSPSLLFEEDIQKEIESFINKRFESDRKVVAQKTSDIAKLITLMGKYLNDAIHSNHQGSSVVSDIRLEIQQLDLSDASKQGLFSLQNRLISAASDIETEMSRVNQKLKSNHSQVHALEKKVKQLEDELQKTKDESAIDFLTGTLTRRAFEMEAKKFEDNFLREGKEYAVMFIDLDHFKSINDNYTHDGGDVVLSTFGKMLLKEIRKTDIVGRFGGEEFVCLSKIESSDSIIQFATRIKNIVAKSKFVFQDHKIKVSFSAGISFRKNHKNLDDAIQQADILLYKAKITRDLIVIENHQDI